MLACVYSRAQYHPRQPWLAKTLYQRPQQLVERTPALRAAALWQPEELGLPAAAMLAELLTHWQEIAAEVTGLAAAGWRLEVLWRSRVGSV